jgi:hypothetical protein
MLSNRPTAANWKKCLSAITCAAGLLSTSAFGEAPGVPPERCQAPDRQQDQNTAPTQDGAQIAAADTEKLSDCNGVLKPPSTGDSDLVQPAPLVGDTPIIPPSGLPQRQQ